MAINLAEKLNRGLSPEAFMEGMTKNKDAFREWLDAFEWPSEADRAYFESLQNRDDLRCLIIAADWSTRQSHSGLSGLGRNRDQCRSFRSVR